jgi:hypothetical protein
MSHRLPLPGTATVTSPRGSGALSVRDVTLSCACGAEAAGVVDGGCALEPQPTSANEMTNLLMAAEDTEGPHRAVAYAA